MSLSSDANAMNRRAEGAFDQSRHDPSSSNTLRWLGYPIIAVLIIGFAYRAFKAKTPEDALPDWLLIAGALLLIITTETTAWRIRRRAQRLHPTTKESKQKDPNPKEPRA